MAELEKELGPRSAGAPQDEIQSPERSETTGGRPEELRDACRCGTPAQGLEWEQPETRVAVELLGRRELGGEVLMEEAGGVEKRQQGELAGWPAVLRNWRSASTVSDCVGYAPSSFLDARQGQPNTESYGANIQTGLILRSTKTMYDIDATAALRAILSKLGSTGALYTTKNVIDELSSIAHVAATYAEVGQVRCSIWLPRLRGGKKYFSVHDVIFAPGVANAIKGTTKEAKKVQGMCKSEGVFPNMIFSYSSSLGLSALHKRDTVKGDAEEVNPGCNRKTYVCR
ncbi:hypothetical protein B0O99DRAFT_594035 [Bisporella sp. PMI_857]|nr:hypothetical protein B0O99DRAFT_594035 [Bisporella sp. PMI_857]